ncbi:MAG TPA: hypothetical protein VLS89_07065 [Candidatus Nanopelagicales bacterium]|nr:hypothetical protein [Candidatus Nanopelagicales bacterium]
MMKTIEETARELAEAHCKVDPATADVYLAPDPTDRVIRLVEVSASVPTTHEFFPFLFSARPDQGIDYESSVILMSPEEWLELKSGSRSLPPGWPPVDQLRRIGGS